MKAHLAGLAMVLAKDNEISLWSCFSLDLVFSQINTCVYVFMVAAGYFLYFFRSVILCNYLCSLVNFLTISIRAMVESLGFECMPSAKDLF